MTYKAITPSIIGRASLSRRPRSRRTSRSGRGRRYPEVQRHRDISAESIWQVLTYRGSGVGLPQADGFRFHSCFVLLDQGWRRCQRSRLVAPVLAESTRAAVQADAWQLDEHRVAQLKAKSRPAALNWSRRRRREEEASNESRAITRD